MTSKRTSCRGNLIATRKSPHDNENSYLEGEGKALRNLEEMFH